MAKKITSTNQTTFTGTEEAFKDLIYKRDWYRGIFIDGNEISTSNAAQIKYRFEGKAKNGVTINMMEQLLIAAGYKVAQQIIWEK